MRFLSGLLLVAVLAACAPQTSAGVSGSQRSAWGLEPVISGFAPDRGEGGSYKVRERVFFSFTLSKPGYVTLVTVDPDTTTVVLERNVRLSAGAHTFPLKSDRNAQGQATYLVFPPTGVSRFRLLFTDVPVGAPTLFQGKLNNDELNRQTAAYVSTAKVRDVAETTIQTVQP
ncbi:MAG: hypothetical protein C4332_03915 [Meiothermus sp.]